jgi:hypothetical protein
VLYDAAQDHSFPPLIARRLSITSRLVLCNSVSAVSMSANRLRSAGTNLGKAIKALTAALILLDRKASVHGLLIEFTVDVYSSVVA